LKFIKTLFQLLVLLLIIQSCTKIGRNTNIHTHSLQQDIVIPDNFFKESIVPGVALNSKSILHSRPVGITAVTASDTILPNNGDSAIVLGSQLTNPYTIANMQQAYKLLYGLNKTLLPTNLYVKFKPTSSQQLAILGDSCNLELQDYPMDYEVLQDGDYYQDPTLGTEDIPWVYSVVPVGYVPPSGIQYQIITQLYIPNDDLLLEDMAESLAAGAMYSVVSQNSNRIITRTDASANSLKIPSGTVTPSVIACAAGYHWDTETKQCVLNSCPSGWLWDGTTCIPECSSGYYWNGTQCVPNPTPPPTYDPKIPRGNINVQVDLGCTSVSPAPAPVRQARVVCKRWFKIWQGYTNDQGVFTCGKKFKHKVKIIVKLENDHAKVSKIRGIRLWQILFPVKKRIGVFNQGDMANINFVFTKPANANSSSTDLPYWAAATSHNSLLEFRDYATEFGIGLPPEHLKVLISNWGSGFRATGITPMFNKTPGDFTAGTAEFFLSKGVYQFGSSVALLITVLKNQIDVVLDYLPVDRDYHCNLTTTTLNELAYHEFGHAAHYNQVGSSFWLQYRNAIANELTKLNMTDFHPYGNGTDASNAPIIATGEMWGYHCQYIFANRKYGITGGLTTRLQGNPFGNDIGLSCYLNALENFNPNLGNDIWRWIPMGLPHDLMDNRNDFNFNGFVTDNVFGYTLRQIFIALQPDVHSIPTFRTRLLQQNNNNQSTQVNVLFTQYGY
jgi:hypothetical protein